MYSKYEVQIQSIIQIQIIVFSQFQNHMATMSFQHCVVNGPCFPRKFQKSSLSETKFSLFMLFLDFSKIQFLDFSGSPIYSSIEFSLNSQSRITLFIEILYFILISGINTSNVEIHCSSFSKFSELLFPNILWLNLSHSNKTKIIETNCEYLYWGSNHFVNCLRENGHLCNGQAS